MATAFEFIKSNGGVTLNSGYPYQASDTRSCRAVKKIATVGSYKLVHVEDEEILKKYLVKFGPIAVAVDASLQSFQSYKSGVYYDPDCTTNVNHAGEKNFLNVSTNFCNSKFEIFASILKFSLQF